MLSKRCFRCILGCLVCLTNLHGKSPFGPKIVLLRIVHFVLVCLTFQFPVCVDTKRARIRRNGICVLWTPIAAASLAERSFFLFFFGYFFFVSLLGSAAFIYLSFSLRHFGCLLFGGTHKSPATDDTHGPWQRIRKQANREIR